MKICKKCLQAKELSEYYKHKGMTDGHLSFCKACVKERTNNHRSVNIDRIRAYDRFRRSPKNMTEAQKLEKLQKNNEWKENNRIKQCAHQLVRYALKRGKLIKKEYCERCGVSGEKKHSKLNAHHKDYLKPLEVIWLCPVCHSAIHKGVH